MMEESGRSGMAGAGSGSRMDMSEAEWLPMGVFSVPGTGTGDDSLRSA